MKALSGIYILTMVALGSAGTMLGAGSAEARRGEREGLNFGTTVRLVSNDERTHAGEGSDKNTHMTSHSSLVNPYIGYAFESLNLGLVFSTEQKTSELKETDVDGTTETIRKSSLNGKGASLFTRFLFGKVFFFEGGAGLYEEKLKVDIETKRATDVEGQFTGEQDAYEVRGVGPGYHLAVGLELQMGGGFYFTSAYQVRIVQLRDLDQGELGRKRSQTQKREALFGIAHYAK